MNPLAILAFILGIQTTSGKPQPHPGGPSHEQTIRDASPKEKPMPTAPRKMHGGGGGSDMN